MLSMLLRSRAKLGRDLGHVAHRVSLQAGQRSTNPEVSVPRNAGLHDDALDVPRSACRRRAVSLSSSSQLDRRPTPVPLGDHLDAPVSGVAGMPDEAELERAGVPPPTEADARTYPPSTNKKLLWGSHRTTYVIHHDDTVCRVAP